MICMYPHHTSHALFFVGYVMVRRRLDSVALGSQRAEAQAEQELTAHALLQAVARYCSAAAPPPSVCVCVCVCVCVSVFVKCV